MQKEDAERVLSENTYIFDSDNPIELVRLINQEQFVNRAMGGSLAGLPPLPHDARILDLACGAGGWVLDVAFEQSDAEVNGVDISQNMVTYANARARSTQLLNASFGVMDITHPLDFADASFDLVHGRFLTGVLKRNAWSVFMAECTRILRPDGILSLTEGDDPGKSLSPALERLNALVIELLWQAEYGFSPNGRTFGMSPALLFLFKQAGYYDLSISTTTFNYSGGTDGWTDFYYNHTLMLQQIKPQLITFGLLTAQEFEDWYQQALIEMNSPDFTIVGQVVSVWSKKMHTAKERENVL